MQAAIVIVLILGQHYPAALAADPIPSACTCSYPATAAEPARNENMGCVCCDYECQCPGGSASMTSDAACMPPAFTCEVTCGETPAPAAGSTSSTEPFTTYSLTNPLVATTPAELVGKFVKMFIGVVGSFALLMFIYGGFTLMTSRGNPEKVQKGKNIFVWAVIGLVVVFSAYVVLTNIFKIIGSND